MVGHTRLNFKNLNVFHPNSNIHDHILNILLLILFDNLKKGVFNVLEGSDTEIEMKPGLTEDNVALISKK